MKQREFTKGVTAQLSQKEYDLLVKAASKRGVSVSKYVRLLIARTVKTEE